KMIESLCLRHAARMCRVTMLNSRRYPSAVSVGLYCTASH
ncbi:unnamed protein product, partial [marine sediment metagenome]